MFTKSRVGIVLSILTFAVVLSLTGAHLITAQGETPQAFSQAQGATGQGQAVNVTLPAGALVQVQYSTTAPQLDQDQQQALDAAFAKSGRTGPKGPTNTSAAGQSTGPEVARPESLANNAPSSLPGDLTTFRNKVIPATG